MLRPYTQGEFVPFITKVTPAKANGAVEKWLVQVESSMLEAVRDSCKEAFKAGVVETRCASGLTWVQVESPIEPALKALGLSA